MMEPVFLGASKKTVRGDMKTYILMDTDVIQKLEQGSTKEKEWILKINSEALLFYSKHTIDELTNYNESDWSEKKVYQYEKERSYFHYISKSQELLAPIAITNEKERFGRQRIVYDKLGLAFKGRYRQTSLTKGTDYRSALKEDKHNYGWKDFALFVPLINWRFNCVLSFDKGLLQLCKENKQSFDKLECELISPSF